MPSRFLIHVNDDELTLQLDDHWFHMPPGEPFEVESSFYCDKLMEIYGPVYGLAELEVSRTRTGINLDIDGGLDLARKALRSSYARAIRIYVDDQLTDRVRKGLPAMPPQGRAAHAIKVMGVNLKQRYGFSPVDYDDLTVPGANPTSDRPPAPDPRIGLMEHQLSRQAQVIAALAKSLGIDPGELDDEGGGEAELGGDEAPAPVRRKSKHQHQPVEA